LLVFSLYYTNKAKGDTNMICEKDIDFLQLLAHWNYFLAIEEDLKQVSRFVEFAPKNYDTYSIELARLLMASTSEVDVLFKEICVSEKKKENMGIKDYRKFFQNADEWDISKKAFIKSSVILPRYNLHFNPWKNWRSGGKNTPDWWDANNDIKHHRSTEFHQANLFNVLNSVSALLAVNLYLIRPRSQTLIENGVIEKPKLLETEHDFQFGWGTAR
jgi:hypothetical protein